MGSDSAWAADRGESEPGGAAGYVDEGQDRSVSRPWRAVSSGAPSAEPGGPEPTDEPAPDTLTGADLIERELGGRVIQEIDGS